MGMVEMLGSTPRKGLEEKRNAPVSVGGERKGQSRPSKIDRICFVELFKLELGKKRREGASGVNWE